MHPKFEASKNAIDSAFVASMYPRAFWDPSMVDAPTKTQANTASNAKLPKVIRMAEQIYCVFVVSHLGYAMLNLCALVKDLESALCYYLRISPIFN